MEIDPAAQGLAQNYKLMTGLVVPRPIAWISTLSEAGKVNLSPFSAFTFCSHNPPMVAISIGRRGGIERESGTPLKDTGQNILRTGEFVVNIVSSDLLQQMHDSSAPVPAGTSEAEALGLECVPCSVVSPPRVKSAPASLECVLHMAVPLGRERSYLMIGEVRRFHLREGLLVNGKIETGALDPVARLGGPNYAGLGRIRTLPQPVLP